MSNCGLLETVILQQYGVCIILRQAVHFTPKPSVTLYLVQPKLKHLITTSTYDTMTALIITLTHYITLMKASQANFWNI